MSGVVPAAAAATVMLVRDGDGGPEVYLMRRSLSARFVAGAHVFPGGRVDPQDLDPDWEKQGTGLTHASANQLLDLDDGGLGYWVAALREAFEEAGVLLAVGDSGTYASFTADGDVARLASLRQAVYRHQMSFLELCRCEGLLLSFDHVAYVARHVTPDVSPIRFDTRFFLARVPGEQEPVHDDLELIDSCWMRPSDALEHGRRGEMSLIEPTRISLEALADHVSVDAMFAEIRGGQRR